ncbi:MAG: methyl-accepting chemotaxis protein [Defluviitaleaceae bacterium]|nr:methyl-accepting chemotaxis protein [Defluviitaleaceae bacterium]
MKLFNSLKFRFIAFFITLIVVLTATLVIMGIRQLSNTVVETFAEQGIRLVEKTADFIDGDAFEALVKSLDINDPFYEETRVWMLQLKEASGTRYLYTMAPKAGDTWMFIIDGSGEPDYEGFSPLGYEEDTSEYGDAFRRVATYGRSEVTGLVDQGEWGWLISAYAPIRNSAGVIVGIVGCDFDGSHLLSAIRAGEIRKVLVGVVFIFIGLALMLFFLRVIFTPIKEIGVILREVSLGEGDLTKRINNIKDNEIGELADSFNKTLDMIKNMVVIIKKEATDLTVTGNELASNMNESASAINEITANIQSIQNRILSQSASVSETHATMEQVVVNINKLDGHVQKQSSNISLASSAIEEMVANTQSVTDTLVKNADNVRVLKNASESGRTGLQEVAADIKEIARESEGLLDINSVMENISSQTNLLSMNAAIEAAHAGEAGRGFAVVAGEIRKLAENSGRQSQTISTVLKKIKEAIDKISRSTANVLEKFEAIDTSVKIVAEQEENVRNSMEEQQEGSRQILEGISNINEITKQVENGSREMLEGAKEVIQESTNLEKATQEIKAGMTEMASGANQMNASVNHIKEISGKNSKDIALLMREVSRFKVD